MPSTVLLEDLVQIKAKTPSQKDSIYAYDCDYNLLMQGSAGTGKTFIALYLALRDVLAVKYRKVIIVRSPVATRDLGHLPGDLEEKISIYELPYKHILWELLPNKMEAYDYLKQLGTIEFHPTSFVRGRTFDNSVIIIDEAQNCNFHELDSVITRVGENSKLIIAGDTMQSDLLKSSRDCSGLAKFSKILENMEEFSIVNYLPQDIVRSGLVKSYIINKEAVLID